MCWDNTNKTYCYHASELLISCLLWDSGSSRSFLGISRVWPRGERFHLECQWWVVYLLSFLIESSFPMYRNSLHISMRLANNTFSHSSGELLKDPCSKCWRVFTALIRSTHFLVLPVTLRLTFLLSIYPRASIFDASLLFQSIDPVSGIPCLTLLFSFFPSFLLPIVARIP
jgi:hypothetical protein